ncbi:MAG: AIR synthase-related protein [Phycisphaerae bacterium]
MIVKAAGADFDALGRQLLEEARRLGLGHLGRVSTEKVYLLSGRLEASQVQRAATALLADPVTQTFCCGAGLGERPASEPAIEVQYQPGVMDPEALSTRVALNELLGAGGAVGEGCVHEVRTARRYLIEGATSAADLELLATRLLANECIQSTYLTGFGQNDALPEALPVAPQVPFKLNTVAICNLDDGALADLSRRAHLFLSVEEMAAIRDHFRALGREPTDLELETLAQTWSEHCVHKTLKADITYRGAGFDGPEEVEIRYDNLLACTIAKATRDLNRDWCLSVFQDNAGVIAFDDDYGVAFKVETHNHPSAIEPYGGAATGIGGCIRDILGCGLGAKPVASTDVFCVGQPDFPQEGLPKGVLHPQRVLKGMVGGVGDYGNRMGIPTVNGAVCFDNRYLANPLVFCGCAGLIRRDRIAKKPQKGDKIVLVGGATGRDGIHGATFSSAELSDTHADEFSHAVQIGNPIEEKKVADALLRAGDGPGGCPFNSVTDCGAGGLSSAVGEMAAELGAVVDLDNVPLKYAGLRYDEIWISEAQERMVLAVPPDRLEALSRIFAEHEVTTAVIGEFTGDGLLQVRYRGTTVGRLDMTFLHEGLPRTHRQARWSCPSGKGPSIAVKEHGSFEASLLAELSDCNVASKEWIIRQYDHEVQGGSVIKPLAGPGSGPGDAAVVRPRLDRWKGIALGCGLAPCLGGADPYRMAIASVDEALRNVICVGGDPDRTAILDNFCWGGVDDAEALGELVRACQGAHDAAAAFGLPFISGKDSLNNQFSPDPADARRLGLPEKMIIPGTLLISAISVMADVRRCISMDLKKPGHRLVLVGSGDGQLSSAQAIHQAVARAIASGRVVAAHDVSDGGLAVAMAEMCIAGELGLDCRMQSADGGASQMLFGPRLTSYLLEVPGDVEWPDATAIGTVTELPRLRMTMDDTEIFDVAVTRLAEAWRRPMHAGPGGAAHG